MTRSASRRRARPAAPPPPRAAAWTPPASVARLAGPGVVAVAGVAMVAHTWGTWPDPLVDYGREVYLAWRVAAGDRLYADLAHFNGPLSVWLNGLVLRVFGPGIVTLALANGALAAACLAMLYALLARTGDRLAATLAGLAFVGVFACSRYVKLGNYTWLCPYSHELTHGLALGVAALWCIHRYQRSRRLGWLAATGAATGLVLLTKAEAILATAVAVPTGLALTLASERPPAARLLRAAALCAAGVAAPLVAAVVAFLPSLPVAEILAWPLGHWRAAARPEFSAMPFYREGFGLDDPSGHLGRIALASVGYAVVLGAAIAAAFVVRVERAAAVALGVTTCVAAALLVPFPVWVAAARPLGLAMVVVAAGAAVAWVRARDDADAGPRAALHLALALFALACLAKLGLNVRFHHYGFALAMPATLVLVAALVARLPAAVTRAGGDGTVVRAIAAGLVAAAVVAHVRFADDQLRRLTTRLGAGADAIRADERGAPLAQALREIVARVRPDQTLVALPEGAMLNYLARRPSGLAYTQWTPLTRHLWGKERMTAAFDRHPPDFVLLVHRDTAHEGAQYFGRDYWREFLAGIERDYRPVWRTGAPPLRDRRFGLVLLERVSPPGSRGS